MRDDWFERLITAFARSFASTKSSSKSSASRDDSRGSLRGVDGRGHLHIPHLMLHKCPLSHTTVRSLSKSLEPNMKNSFVTCLLIVAAAGAFIGCSVDASSEDDFGSADSALVSPSEQGLVGSYTNTAGDLFAAGGLYKLELKKDKTFVAQRQAPASQACVRAPCTVVFTGSWSAANDGSRLSLRHGEHVTGLRRYDLARAQDGGPLAFVDRTTGARFTMKSDAAASSGTGLVTGDFKIFANIPTDPTKPILGSCVPYTQLTISRTFTGYSAHLDNRVGTFGTDVACALAVNPMPRDYMLSYSGTSCGSTTWNGSTNAGGSATSIEITDHSTRTCRDLVPSKLIEKETSASGEVATRSLWTVEVFDGTLLTTMGIGGENTGASIKVGASTLELVLSQAQRSELVDGRFARVTGSRTKLSGVETHDRAAINVLDVLTCPASGRTLNCMPPQSKVCAPETRNWIHAKCEGVLFTD